MNAVATLRAFVVKGRLPFAAAIALPLLAGAACAPPSATGGRAADAAGSPARTTRPNILLIVADDLGYSDLGIYGSEIATPNLDALAAGGVRFTGFYASPMCSTTRAMLLTGVDHHLAGLGNLAERLSDNQRGRPGYEGHLNERVATLAEVLKDAGYRTYMTGKWHLGAGPAQGPTDRGFERAFALLESGAGHFDNMLPLLGPERAAYSEDGVRLDALPEDFYSSRFYAEQLIEYVETDAADVRPFFAYLSFTVPHFPLQAPRESIARYRGRYDEGYDAIHAERLKNMQRLGLVAEDARAFPLLVSVSPWSGLSAEERAVQARVMEIYAAMIDDMDRYVGAVVDYLRDHDLYENTVIIFLSDNGAEGHYLEWGLDPLVPWAKECCNNSLGNLGNADSYVMLGPAWARVAVAPLRMFKGFTSEGGIRVPAIVHHAGRIPAGRIVRSPATVLDVMPTLLELAGVAARPGSFRGREVLPMQGVSLLPVLYGTSDRAHGEDVALAWEVFGKRALRQGDFKIVWENVDVHWWDSEPLGIRRNAWQLYDLAADPAELTDLSSSHPDRLQQMIAGWEDYARENGVIIPDKQRGY